MQRTCPVDGANLRRLDADLWLCTNPSQGCNQYWDHFTLTCQHDFGDSFQQEGKAVVSCAGCGLTVAASNPMVGT